MSRRPLSVTPARQVFFSIPIEITGGHMKFKLDERDRCLQHLLGTFFSNSIPIEITGGHMQFKLDELDRCLPAHHVFLFLLILQLLHMKFKQVQTISMRPLSATPAWHIFFYSY